MKRVYAIKFRTKWSDGTGYPDSAETLNTIATEGEEAVRKVKAAAIRETYTSDETGKKHHVTGFRLVGIEEVCQIDV